MTYQERQKFYLESEIVPASEANEGNIRSSIPGVFNQIARLVLGRGPLNEKVFGMAFELIRTRQDCADFAMAGLLRILYRFPGSPLLTPGLRSEIEAAALGFCYWYDQPGVRGMCFHTENHQILFHAAEHLAGSLFPDRRFSNDGRDGAWHMQHGADLAGRWMEQRARFGFSEWLSNCYFDEDMLALLNLVDFSPDPGIRQQAAQLVDMLLLEIALHHNQGVLATTHGRTYAPWILQGRLAPTSTIAWMVFGAGTSQRRTNYTLVSLCTSDYQCPPVVQAIAADRNAAEVLLKERHGLSVEDAPAYGVNPADLEQHMFFWACQTARHPALRPTALRVAEIAQDPWLENFITKEVDLPLAASRKLVESAGAVFDGDAVNTALSPVDIVTYRTPDYQLSCAQDFRPGRPGYQQHIWHASLDPDAVVFTNHPGTDNEDGAHLSRPNFWAGNRWLPRAAQHRSVLVCIHHVPPEDPRPYSHAWFPRQHFDQVEQRDHWVFARKGNGYLALYSQYPARWADQGPYAGIELRADAPDNIWICELGRTGVNGSFGAFTQAILEASVTCEGLRVTYASPSQGQVCFGWNDPLTVDGKEIALHGYPRFANPYCEAEIGQVLYTVRHGDETLVLDFSELRAGNYRI